MEVPESMQADVHESIYNPEWGIKARVVVSKQARDNFLNYVEILRDGGAEIIILGCTEIPVALPEEKIEEVPLINPVVSLANAFICAASSS